MPRPSLSSLAAAGTLLTVLALPAAASGRALLVATGTPELVIVEVATDAVVARLPVGGPGAGVTGVATSPNGDRGYAAAGNTLVEIDIDTRTELRRVTVPGAPITALRSTRSGRLVALQGDTLTMLDPAMLVSIGTVGLGGPAQTFNVDRAGSLAAAVRDDGRVAQVALTERRLLRTIKVERARSAAIDSAGRTWVGTPGMLRMIPKGKKKVSKRSKLELPAGAGGTLAFSPLDGRLAVGPAAGSARGAVVNLGRRTVRAVQTGRGPALPEWNIDATRLYYADRAGASVSVVGAANRRRLDVVALPGTTPFAVAEQPGLALLSGTEAPNALTGTGGPDRMEGLGGNDMLRGGRGRDVVNGGAGDDRLSGGSVSDRMDGADGNDFGAGGPGDDTITLGAGQDGADGGTGNDTIDGGTEDDVLDGGDGDDIITGGEGNDRIIEKGFGNDKRLAGGPGDDIIDGGRGSDRAIEGEDGNDMLTGGPGKETISGGNGNDILDGGRAGDDLRGDAGDDQMKGDAADDRMIGAEGNDTMDGGSGVDRIDGGVGNDMITGGPGTDTILAGDGDDTIRAADDSLDAVDCGPGVDKVLVEGDFPTRDQLISCEVVEPIVPEAANDTMPPSLFFGSVQPEFIRGTPGDDSILGNGGNDRLFGGNGNDYVDGGNGDDEMHGGQGDDIMPGRKNDDEIDGDAGDDRITGDRGRDDISGGAGNDNIFGNLDEDTIDGGPGDDRINVVGGGKDVVKCGPGNDRVFADARDKVSASDCERISR